MNVYEQQPLTCSQRRITRESVNTIGEIIIRHFKSLPQSHISPSELKELYNLPNPIHSIRPRMVELEKRGFLQRLDSEKVLSPFGGEEARYISLNSNQLSLI